MLDPEPSDSKIPNRASLSMAMVFYLSNREVTNYSHHGFASKSMYARHARGIPGILKLPGEEQERVCGRGSRVYLTKDINSHEVRRVEKGGGQVGSRWGAGDMKVQIS